MAKEEAENFKKMRLIEAELEAESTQKRLEHEKKERLAAQGGATKTITEGGEKKKSRRGRVKHRAHTIISKCKQACRRPSITQMEKNEIRATAMQFLLALKIAKEKKETKAFIYQINAETAEWERQEAKRKAAAEQARQKKIAAGEGPLVPPKEKSPSPPR